MNCSSNVTKWLGFFFFFDALVLGEKKLGEIVFIMNFRTETQFQGGGLFPLEMFLFFCCCNTAAIITCRVNGIFLTKKKDYGHQFISIRNPISI